MSVISPSPRTHYLNITPGNVVLVYAPSKDSENVHKIPWQASPVSLNIQNSNSPSVDNTAIRRSLTQIVQESEQELTTPPRLQPQRRSSPETPILSSPMFEPFRNRNFNSDAPFRSPLNVPRKETTSVFSPPMNPASRITYINDGPAHCNPSRNNSLSQLSSKTSSLSYAKVCTSVYSKPDFSEKKAFDSNYSTSDLDTSFPDDDEDLLLLSCDVPPYTISKNYKKSQSSTDKVTNLSDILGGESSSKNNDNACDFDTRVKGSPGRNCSISRGDISQISKSPSFHSFEGISFSPDLTGHSTKSDTPSTSTCHQIEQRVQVRPAGKENPNDLLKQMDDVDSGKILKTHNAIMCIEIHSLDSNYNTIVYPHNSMGLRGL